MKQIITVLTAAALTGAAIQSRAQSCAWFSAEGSNYYLVSGCNANSALAWHAEKWGGRLLKTTTVNGAGELRLQTETAFLPAFMLSTKPTGGSGVVTFMDAPEFALQTIKAGQSANVVTVTWEATVTPGVPIIFEILKAAPGEAYKVAGSYSATQPGILQSYTFTDQRSPGSTYRLRIRNEAVGERYLTRALLQRGTTEAVAVYPTQAHEFINIAGAAGASYSIIAADGKVVREGMLQSSLQTLPLIGLASGSYVVSVRREDGVTTAKLIKE